MTHVLFNFRSHTIVANIKYNNETHHFEHVCDTTKKCQRYIFTQIQNSIPTKLPLSIHHAYAYTQRHSYTFTHRHTYIDIQKFSLPFYRGLDSNECIETVWTCCFQTFNNFNLCELLIMEMVLRSKCNV